MKIADYTYEEFLSIAATIARGHAPLICGRRMSYQQYLIMDTLAAYHQNKTESEVERKCWDEYRNVVLLTRLEPMERNKLYDARKAVAP